MNGIVIYVLLCAAVLAVAITPFDSSPGGRLGPDLLVAFTFFRIINAPKQTPLPVVLFVFFIADIVLLRPPGLMTLVMLIAAGFLRSRAADLRAMPFIYEWLFVALVIVGVYVGYSIGLFLLFLPQNPPGMMITVIISTVFVYPVMTGFVFVMSLIRQFGKQT